ncbi:protein unc-93 homolog A-like [Littorina saxatilis]|uniref:protein unc-93 homolog A-like n=1 Tax=Littorina saxatilis TaxID=31220 RepID=UPI0038B5AD55
MKNTVAVSFSFLFLFTSFQSLSNLQTSLNMESEIGSQSLLAIYTSLIVSCIFLPKFVIAHFGCKWTIPVSMLLYTLYMVANIFPKRWLMILTGIGVGIGGGPLWSAKCTYLTQIGIWYADLTNQSEDAVINKLFGFFFMLFQTSQVWGNLISSTVLNEPPASNVIANTTVMCGAEFSPPTTANEDTTQQFRQPAYLQPEAGEPTTY